MKAKSIKGDSSCKEKIRRKAISFSGKIRAFPFLFLMIITSVIASAQTKEQMANEVWQREIAYWQFVDRNDTTAYKNLWHEDFIGYAGNDITNKSHIADWIEELFKNQDLKYTVDVHKKAVNVVDNVVMTFYDEDDIFTNIKTGAVTKETFKITHTWKKYGNAWLIIGGMDGFKK